jgi:hypothetical protein
MTQEQQDPEAEALAETGYNAYFKTSESGSTGAQLAGFAHQDEHVKKAWIAAAKAMKEKLSGGQESRQTAQANETGRASGQEQRGGESRE